ncbi:M28 family peptidase [Myxococcota bacterium]|nr:M28 family peptidase [Myxococcota bacterium]
MSTALSLIALLSACKHQPPAAPVAPPAPPAFDHAACFSEVAQALSSDEMEGRGTGTPGLDRARDWLAARFTAMGLEPVGGTGQQQVPVTLGVALGEGNALAGGKARDLSRGKGVAALGEAWTPLGFSSNGAFEGGLVFAGYGIRAEELGYDDYAGLDVQGKVVLALRFEPGESDEKSIFDGRMPTRWSDLRYKALRAREAGAAALILVTGPTNAGEGEPDGLPRLKPEGPTSVAGIPVLQVTRAVAQAWLSAGGQDLAALQAAIDAQGKPQSKALPQVTVKGRVELVPQQVSSTNLLFRLPGAGALAEETVVLAAHYDHLGMGGRGSMKPDVVAVHNGADDNASGVAALACAAEALVKSPPDGDRRGVLFAAFTAEELGLGGSGWYAENPALPLDRTVAMINMDMVGRVREGRLQAMGTDSAVDWPAVLEPLATAHGLTLQVGGDGYGPSDHMSFYTKGVPVVHFFSGSHTEYHSPEDDFATLNVDGGARVAALAADAAATLSTRAERLAYVKGSSGSPMLGDSRGYGSYLGTIPDYATMMEPTGGVKLSGVREGGPAALAGLVAGDRIIGLGRYTVGNLYDMTFALRDHKPGEVVDIKILRDGQELVLPATLKSREGEEKSRAGASPHAGGASTHAPGASTHAARDPLAVPGPDWAPKAGKEASHLIDPRESHLADLRQLTFGGDNAEAYWNPDGRSLIFQWTPPEGGCDQQYLFNLDTGERTLLSSGKGRTTCGYADWAGSGRYIYATTEGASAECPPPPDMSKGYTWALYDGFDLVWQAPGQAPAPFLPAPGYDAEATACMQDGRIVFTSVRDGDLELYTVKPDGSELTRLTHTPGYDGGAFFTTDCQHIVWRASRPEGEALADYQALLAEGLVRPSQMELYVMKADGTEVKQLTTSGKASFGPYPLPGDTGLIFSSNMGGSAREFDLWTVGMDGGTPQQVTYTPAFDGFPMFSPDGRWLIFASNRGGDGKETNLFIARWKP